MKKQENIESLINISHQIGANISYIQGGGGNTSVKINDNLMAIKSSGTNLIDMSKQKGQTLVDFKKITELLKEPSIKEDDFSKKINSFSYDKSQRPSIETGFHSLLGKFVIHTHSVFINVLLCSKEGKLLVKDLFPKSIWVDYFSPGKNLTLAIKKELEKEKKKFSEDIVVFLQNHGLIVSSGSGPKSLKLHKKVNQEVRSYYNLSDFKIINSFDEQNKAIFPDQIVYLDGTNEDLSKSAKETLSAYSYIIKEIKKLKLTPNYLTKGDIRKIKSMESEKYRKSLEK